MSLYFLMHLQTLFLLLLGCTQQHVYHAYTYEPPGRDPVSIDKIRSSEKAVILTTDNFDETIKGKLAFIKLYAPYCPHCKEMAGAWNELATYYEDLPNTDNILIGSIDCTDSPKGKELCARFKVMGLPTLLYGDASLGGLYLEEYGGDKAFKDLKSFAAEALVPKCNPGNLDACEPDERKEVGDYMVMSYYDLDEKIKGMEKHQKDLKTTYKENFADLQKKYDQYLMEKEMKITMAKANVMLIKDIMATKKE